jgi:hypothetical protein|tara:strand:+ start:79 stop:318 length:240 start_codon:yes stop_codon:yes gene_type:complete
MIDLTTLAKLKTTDKELSNARVQMVKLCIDRKNINIGKLYNQVQVAWRTIEEVLREADPDYIEKKWDRQRKRQNKRLKK